MKIRVAHLQKRLEALEAPIRAKETARAEKERAEEAREMIARYTSEAIFLANSEPFKALSEAKYDETGVWGSIWQGCISRGEKMPLRHPGEKRTDFVNPELEEFIKELEESNEF